MMKTEVIACPHCGRSLSTGRVSGWEIAINLLSAVVVLTAVFFVCRLADHWLVTEFDKVTDHTLWRQPMFDVD